MIEFTPEQQAAIEAACAQHLEACRDRPAPPNDQELQVMYGQHLYEANFSPSQAAASFARAVLARWGRPTPQPIPVSERLPGPEYCDAEGLCWWWRTDDSDEWWELLCITDAREYNARCGSARYTHWLPAHALPLPTND